MPHELFLQTTLQISMINFWIGVAVIVASLCSTVFIIGQSYAKKVDINTVDEKLKDKAEQKEMAELRLRVEKKADKDYVDLVMDVVEKNERRHEVANTQLQSLFLRNVEEINKRMEAIQNQIVSIINK